MSTQSFDPRARLLELGLELPSAPAALAAYVPTRRVPLGNGTSLLYVAGQVPFRDGQPASPLGAVPSEVSLEQAQAAARICAMNLLAQVDRAAGLDKVEMVAELTVFVRSSPGFTGQPDVANAASTLLGDVLGEAGRHTRAAVGSNELPRGVPVEISAVVVVRD